MVIHQSGLLGAVFISYLFLLALSLIIPAIAAGGWIYNKKTD
jgi:hypothetical protein